MQLVLNRLRYHVDCTLDAAETLACLAAQRYDLLFVALALPDGSGLDLARRLRREVRWLRRVPIVLFGDAWDEAAVRRACADAGLQGYLAKPLSIGRWLGVIRELTLNPRGEPAVARGFAEEPAPAPLPPDGAVLDLERLRDLTDDDMQLVLEIGTLYVGTARQYLEEIESARAAGRDASRAAHALKGASRNIGAEAVGSLAERVEKQGPDDATMRALHEALGRVADYFDALAGEPVGTHG